MGTSRSNRLPRTKAFKKLAGSLRSPVRDPSVITQFALSAAIDYIPITYASSPLLFAAVEGIEFASLTKEVGFEAALKEFKGYIIKNYIGASISLTLWKSVISRSDPKYMSSPYGRLAEIAFKKTYSSIIKKGAKALEG